MIEISIAITSQNEYDDVRIEYGQIINESVITKGDDDIRYEVYNVYKIHIFTHQDLNKNVATVQRTSFQTIKTNR